MVVGAKVIQEHILLHLVQPTQDLVEVDLQILFLVDQDIMAQAAQALSSSPSRINFLLTQTMKEW